MGSSVISPEDVLHSLMNDGTIDAMRLKIINQLRANEELKKTTISLVEQSKVLNTPGAEKQTKRELFAALRQELETQALEKASKSVWELIMDKDGIGKEINETVERVFCQLSGRDPPLFPPVNNETNKDNLTEKRKPEKEILKKKKLKKKKNENLESSSKKRKFREMSMDVEEDESVEGSVSRDNVVLGMRCHRTDGKNWRCAKDAAPDSKYCERHMYRGSSSRAKKPLETASHSKKQVQNTSRSKKQVVTTSRLKKLVESTSRPKKQVETTSHKNKLVVGASLSKKQVETTSISKDVEGTSLSKKQVEVSTRVTSQNDDSNSNILISTPPQTITNDNNNNNNNACNVSPRLGSSPKTAPESAEGSSPKTIPETLKVSSPKTTPESVTVSSPKTTPESMKVSSPKTTHESVKDSSPKTSLESVKGSSPKTTNENADHVTESSEGSQRVTDKLLTSFFQ